MSRDTYTYRDILIKGGYFTGATTHVSSGLVPKDAWIGQNLKAALDIVVAEKKRRET